MPNKCNRGTVKISAHLSHDDHVSASHYHLGADA